jgi:beta-glucanase (GH16 family)
MKDYFYNKWLDVKTLWRYYTNKTVEYNKDLEELTKLKLDSKEFTFNEDGHTWGKYHPDNLNQYWSKSFVKQIYNGDNKNYTYKLNTMFNPKVFNGVSIPYGTGVIVSNEKFMYGYFTCNIEFSNARRLWPAFWLYNGDESYSEIDIVEAYSNNGNYDKGKKLQPNLHYKLKGNNSVNTGSKDCPLPVRYLLNHKIRFSLSWNRDYIKWFYNGYLVKIITDKGILNKMNPMMLVLNSAVQDNSDYYGLTETIFSNIKIYQ